MENKEYHDGGFQQQSPQRLVDIYEHMNSRNDRWVMRLKAIEAEYYSIEKLKKLESIFCILLHCDLLDRNGS